MSSTSEPEGSSETIDDRPPRLSRSPHPYHRWSEQETSQSMGQDQGYLPSPAPTPSPSDTEDDSALGRQGPKESPEESGTEVEDEGVNLIKALPAPPIQPRKGLRHVHGAAAEGDITPLLTPSQLHEDGRRLSTSYFERRSGGLPILEKESTTKADEAWQKFTRRRRAELIRRASELLSLFSVGYIVLFGASFLNAQSAWRTGVFRMEYWTLKMRSVPTEVLCHAAVVFSAVLLYPLRLLLRPLLHQYSFKIGSLGVPATFDPAPLLYPPFLPVMVALSLASAMPKVFLPNVILGLSALPHTLFPLMDSSEKYNSLHWLVTLIPLFTGQSPQSSYSPGSGSPALDHELLSLLFPLHQALLPALYYLTTSSLLPSELQLLSISLVNLLILSSSSQAKLLRNILWIGGIGLLFLCQHALKWNVALERVPNWRFRRAGRVMATARTFLTTLTEGVNNDGSDDESQADGVSHEGISISSAWDFADKTNRNGTSKPLRNGARRIRRISDVTKLNVPSPAPGSEDYDKIGKDLKRTRSTGSSPTSPSSPIRSPTRHKRRQSASSQWFLSMTPKQILTRKWGYALYTYVVSFFLILVPIRIAIGSQALNGHEPFGWAVGYLFGDLPGLRPIVQSLGLDTWVALPAVNGYHNAPISSDWVEKYRQVAGSATTRLLLFGYWAVVIAIGLLTVLFGLKSTVEVDTRRKVFHGMMVVMLLPSTFIDPCFLALGLTLVLSVFLLLDLFRASQLKPLSKPLATFLTPYVDGRDLRGPVVVSHIFLLIGCAIPLWLSLAGIERREAPPSNPWKGWELETRDVSMVAGVVCVGMGDAAASLIGRRFGRRKWPWAGGKSLEGSAAFAAAVSVGLLAGKAWLRVGGWKSTYDDRDTWMMASGKAVIAACGASFTEAVLTGANDNVVVPVVLWLLVRGLHL